MTVSKFILQRQAITRFVRDALQSAVDKQKENADKHGKKNMSIFKKINRELLSKESLQDAAAINLGESKFTPRFFGPF